MKVWFFTFIILFGTFLQAQDAVVPSLDTIKTVSDFATGGSYSLDLDKEILALADGRKKSSCTRKTVTYTRPKTKTDTKPKVPTNPYDICKRQAKLQGYKIQIYYSKDRNAANKVRNTFKRQFPGIIPELVYWQPDYRVLVGDYFSRKSGASDFKKIRDKYPAAFMVKHRIYCRRAK